MTELQHAGVRLHHRLMRPQFIQLAVIGSSEGSEVGVLFVWLTLSTVSKHTLTLPAGTTFPLHQSLTCQLKLLILIKVLDLRWYLI